MRRRTPWRRTFLGRLPLGVVVLFTLALVVAVPTSAQADTGVSSVLISNALPGMVEAPLGPLNGAITPSEIDSTFGSSGPAGVLSQAIASGDVSAYIRTWSNQPPNGAFVQVIAAQFPSLAEASAALAGADNAMTVSHFGRFAVPEIAQAVGFTRFTNSRTGVLFESVVQFAKGAVLFDVGAGRVTTAATSGAPELGNADAAQVARQQAAMAPGPALGPTDPSATQQTNPAYQAGRYFGMAVLFLLVAGLVVILVQRRSKRQTTVATPADAPGTPFPAGGAGGGHVSPLDGAPNVAASSAGLRGAALLERPTARKARMFYCSWCGTVVAVGAQVVHDCGSRDKAGTYYMNCGTRFTVGATVCTSCGSRKLQ